MKIAMPCPRCDKRHLPGSYVKRPDLKKPNSKGMPVAPPDINCECGATLRLTVPLFSVGPEGWIWRII